MDLNTIKEYNHRIDKISVTNNNQYSLYSEVIFKVNLDDKYINDNEIVRFSLQPNDDFVQHQRFDNDYYFRIPNVLKTDNNENITYVYAHYFPSDLYDYEEDDQIFSIYDFRELLEEHPVDHYYGDPYEIQINKEKYDWHIDEAGRLVVQSLLKNSVNNFNDPNYKNYITDDHTNNNMTEKGMFPLSSKYRAKQNWIAPNLNDEYPLWEEYQESNHPFWEARINRTGLSPLITNGVENDDWNGLPFNVYLNYEYLPTSREYHQHYFGFEPTNNECKTINVFEGTNINTIDDKFGSSNNYRLITRDNPYDDNRSMYVQHGYEIPLSFQNFVPSQINSKPTCQFEKNLCDNFYEYSATLSSSEINCGDGHCKQTIHLTEGDYYSLRFYMYIPSYAHLENCNTCYVTVTANPTDKFTYWEDLNDDMIQYDDTTREKTVDERAIYKINDAFLQKDKQLKDQWIYHEIPFKAGDDNIITIVGPQTKNNEDDDNTIFFADMSLFKMEEYSPTVKYTNTGLYIIEKDQYAFKSAAEELCDSIPITPDNKKWNAEEKKLPQPYNQIYMVLDNDTYLEYDDSTTNLYFVHPDDEPLKITHYITDNEDYIKIICDESFDNQAWYDTNETDLYASYKDFLVLVRGTNNKINIKVQDITGHPITNGSVKASILKVKNKETDSNATLKNLKEREVINGQVNWYGINLTDLESSGVFTENGEKYYLRLEYNNPCHNQPYIDFKTFYLVEEIMDMDITINGDYRNEDQELIPGHNYWIRNAIDEYGEIINFPIQINAYITDQLGQEKLEGYCELSIDDIVIQTTLVDLDGKADFYLDFNDIHTNCQTIKIEYYTEYYHSVVFKYFNLCIDPSIDLRPAIPIDIKVLENGQTRTITDSYTIDYDDVLLCNISSNHHSEFNLKIEAKIDDGNYSVIKQQNILNPNTEIEFFDMPYEDNNTHTLTYRITTGNQLTEYGTEVDNKYRSYSRIFKVFRNKNNSN